MPSAPRCLCLLVAATAIIGATSAAAAPEPTYLIILDRPEAFSAQFRAPEPAAPRQVGWGAVLYTLSTPVEELRRHVEGALDTSERTGYPLLLHLDDWNFPPPSTDPDWCEWTAFPAPGETHGPLVRRRWLNWGSWTVTGPPPNYESPTYRAFMRSQLLDGIAGPLARRLAKWRREGRAHLFAGLVVGWESGYYSMPPPSPRPATDTETFEDSEVVTTGYAALTRRGYTAERLAAEARSRGLTEPALFRLLMTDVVHDYTDFLCRVCSRAGLPRNRLYTHYATAITNQLAEVVAADGRMLPIRTAANNASRPGLTMTRAWADFDKVAAELRAAGRRDWGAVEIEVTPDTRDQTVFHDQLQWLSEHGAKVLCLYGWWEAEGHVFSVRGTGAVAAMQQWLGEASAQ